MRSYLQLSLECSYQPEESPLYDYVVGLRKKIHKTFVSFEEKNKWKASGKENVSFERRKHAPIRFMYLEAAL